VDIRPIGGAAIAALHSGFDQVVKKITDSSASAHPPAVPGRRRARRAEAIPPFNELYTDCWTTMDVSRGPTCSVSQTPFVNAGATGWTGLHRDQLGRPPSCSMTTRCGRSWGTSWSRDERHALYVTILILISISSFSTLPFLAGIACCHRIACSSGSGRASSRPDRAVSWRPGSARRDAHASQDGRRGDMKQMNLDEFLVQAKDYEDRGRPRPIFQILNSSTDAPVQHAACRRAAALDRSGHTSAS